MKNFDDLTQAVYEAIIEYWPVKPPITFEGEFIRMDHADKKLEENAGKFRFSLDPTIQLSAFREKVRKIYSRKDLRVIYKQKDFSSFAIVFNHLTMHKKDKTYVLATHGGDCKCLGLMTHYNFVKHTDLLNAIEAAGLAHETSGYLSLQEMAAYIQVSTKSQGTAYMKVSNGYTGTKSLSYSFAVKINSYEYSEAFQHASKRHLSHVGELVNNINEAITVARDMKIIDKLENMSYEKAYNVMLLANPELTKRQQFLLDSVDKPSVWNSDYNALMLMEKISQYHSTRGYGASVDKLLDPIVNLSLIS